MPLRNRVDPFGDLHVESQRGMFTGNRGCLVDDEGRVVRHHRGQLWITCLTRYRGWRVGLARPGRWTPIFFLDDAVALAAGHRPCGLCRRADYQSYRAAVTRAEGLASPLGADDLNRRLASQRLRPGRGLDRAADRRLWPSLIDDLPVGTVIVDGDRLPHLVTEDRLFAFSFAGWQRSTTRPSGEMVEVLTPRTSVAALGNGFTPTLHPSSEVARDQSIGRS
jgi:hypothetical protein